MQVSANQTVNGTYITHYANADRDYTLTLTKSNMDKYSNLMLLDLKTGTATPLDDSLTEYDFTSSTAGSAEKRFLITGQKIVSNEDSSDNKKAYLSGYYAAGEEMLVLENKSGREGTYSIYAVSGQQIEAGRLPEGVHYRSVSLAPGTYLAYLRAGTARETVKMVVIRK